MLSNNTTIRPLGTLRPGTAAQAGIRTTIPCYKGKRTLAWHVVVEGDVTPTTHDAQAVVDTGSILNIFTECGVNDGADRLPSTPQDMAFMTQIFNQKTIPSKRLTTLTAGVTSHLKERFSVFASPPFAANREEVSFMEHNLRGDFYFYIKQVAEGATLGVNAGALVAKPGATNGDTVVVSNVVVRVYQEFVANGGKNPIFQPRWEQDTITVDGINHAAIKTHLKDYYFQGVLFKQNVVGVSRVGDIIANLKQSQTGRVIIGDEMMATDDLQTLLDGDFPGATYTLGGVNPYIPFWYQRGGRLSKVLKPRDPNFATTLDQAVSATSGSSQVAITYFMLDRDEAVREDGSRVTLTDQEVAATGLAI